MPSKKGGGSFDLIGELLAEHSKVQAGRIARWAAEDRSNFSAVVKVFAGGDPLLTQRSSWIIGLCADTVPGYFPPHLKVLIDKIDEPGIHPSGPRNVLRALMRVPLPPRLKGRIVDRSARYISSSAAPIAVRCEAMYVLARLAEDYPELRQELHLLAAPWERHESPGIRSAVRRILGRKPER
jgi:hypothetical protein